MKMNFASALKTNRHKTLDQLTTEMKGVLQHLFNNHDGGHSWYYYAKQAATKEESYNPPPGHQLSTVDDTHIKADLENIFDEYTSKEQMKKCHHPWGTQLNESLNQSISSYTPKRRNYSKSLENWVALVVGIHSLGPIVFFSKTFHSMGMQTGNILLLWLHAKEGAIASCCKYQLKTSTKHRWA